MPTAPRPGTRPFYIELPLDLAERLEAAAQANRRTLKAEFTLAIERHVTAEPPASTGHSTTADATDKQKREASNLPTAQSLLPTTRGRYLLYLGEPILRDGPRWVHFSWRGESFCLRDFITGGIRRQDRTLSANDVWRAAKKRTPATGKFYHPVGDWDWWKSALDQLSRRENSR